MKYMIIMFLRISTISRARVKTDTARVFGLRLDVLMNKKAIIVKTLL